MAPSGFPPKDFKSWSRFHGSRGTMFSRNPLSNISRTVLDFYVGLFAPRQESNSCQSSNCHLSQVQGNPPLFGAYQFFQLGYTFAFDPTTQEENGQISLN
jgi:hypothetical protein